jgi:uncharacterized protein
MTVPPLRIDCHVHVVGDGSSGSGCVLKDRGLLARYMLYHIGLPQSALHNNLDKLYIERLAEMVTQSSIDAVMVLAHDQVYDESGRVMEGISPFYVPNSYVLSLSKEYSFFLPAVSIHPARKDAMDELNRCIEGGALMLKCLPNCQNINCNDRRFTPFWLKMAQAGIVLLAHTGGELTLPVVAPQFASPETLRLALECGVTVIAAHAATNAFLDRNYLPELRRMLAEYPNMYADNSALILLFRARHLRECLQPEISARIVYGSDIPVPITGRGLALRGLIDWKTFRRIEHSANVLEKDYQLKRAVGFPEETFTRLSSLLRLEQRKKPELVQR